MLAWLVITLGLALGYIPSYVISQQTMIYYVMRKKVDGIEMNEVFEEADAEEKPLQPVPPAPAAPAASEKPAEKREEPPKPMP
jgi:ribosomal protein L12E/L44/L45/RPP1/RPP2